VLNVRFGSFATELASFSCRSTFRFAAKADLIASTGGDSARPGDLCESLIPAEKTGPERACKSRLYVTEKPR
jgi:hypothetical protein